MSSMEHFVSAVRATLSERFPRQRHLFFGHIGDGNLHVLSGPYEAEDMVNEVERAVYLATREAGGCISAEHGIGVIKREFLRLSRSPEELHLMRGLKQLFDPAHLLNAGRIL
jgi:FAD/FMN-containing dehydrogenase